MKKTFAVFIRLSSFVIVSVLLAITVVATGVNNADSKGSYCATCRKSGVTWNDIACSTNLHCEMNSYSCAIYYHTGCMVTPVKYYSVSQCSNCGALDFSLHDHDHLYRHSYGVSYNVCPYNPIAKLNLEMN